MSQYFVIRKSNSKYVRQQLALLPSQEHQTESTAGSRRHENPAHITQAGWDFTAHDAGLPTRRRPATLSLFFSALRVNSLSYCTFQFKSRKQRLKCMVLPAQASPKQCLGVIQLSERVKNK